MTAKELQEFRDRVVAALHHGWGIAKAEEYAAELVKKGATMLKGIEVPSPAHLLAMIDEVLNPQEKKSAAAPEAKPEPKVEAKMPEPDPELVEEPAAAAEVHDDLSEMLQQIGDDDATKS